MKTNNIKIGADRRGGIASTNHIDDKELVVTGKFLKVAAVHDEIWREGEVVADPGRLIAKLKSENYKADIFVFAQKIPKTKPCYGYYYEWDNFAVIPIISYLDWWEKRLPQESRRNVRISAKRGVAVKEACFDDELVRGITAIYNETPTRQGRAFGHYGKDANTVRIENGTYLERSQFVGAYYGDELIGFLKLVYIDEVASIMQILSKNAHLDKKPMNALLAKAVELCEKRGSRYLVYRKFTYGNVYSPLTEFKRRNGFVEMQYPRYYVPLTWKGKLGLRLRVHHGLRDSLPAGVIAGLVSLRSKYVDLISRKKSVAARTY